MEQSRILVADDHPLVREGMSTALSFRYPGIAVDCAGSVEQALALVRANRAYRLILLDYQLPDAQGFSGLFQLRHAADGVPVAIMSGCETVKLVEAARVAGAAGFLCKCEPLDQMIAAIGRILQGERIFPVGGEADAGLLDLKARLDSLSPAQMRVLAALAGGHLNKQIAYDLGLTERTVKAHMTAIFRKLGVANRLQALIAVRPLFAEE